MNRRDFLLLHTEGRERIADLSCQKLFVHYLDLNSGVAQGNPESGLLNDADWWSGEPPLETTPSAPEDFFRSVQSELLRVDRLRVVDMDWMVQGDFRLRVETLLTAFKATGGEIIYGSNEESQAT